MSFLSRLFRSKAQKAVDALQENLDRRLWAVQGGLELFKKATDAFDGSGDEEEEKSFRLAQGKHQFFTNALIDDLGRVEELIKTMRRDLDYNSGRPPAGFASNVIEAEKMLEDTDKNVERLTSVTQELLDLAGESVPDDTPLGKDRASLKVLLAGAKDRKSELNDTMAHMDKILDDMIAQHEETGAISDPDLAKKATAFMRAGTALSLAEDEWIEFLQTAIKAPSVDPFREEIGRKGAWLEERWKIYENARTKLLALVQDTDDGSA